MSIANNRIEDTCVVYLDGMRLPTTADAAASSIGLVALSPIEISWGGEHPWDDPTPAVASLTLLDVNGKYTNRFGNFAGRRITIRPDYADAPDESVSYCAVFDGRITDATLDMSNGTPRININAADMMYVALNDTEKIPNTGTAAKYAKGYQGYPTGDMTEYILARLRKSGINSGDFNYSTYQAPYELSEKVSLVDYLWGIKTNSQYTLTIDRMAYMDYQTQTPADAPKLRFVWFGVADYLRLDGGTIVDMNDNGAVADFHIPASEILCARDATLSVPEYYTRLDVGYYVRSLSNPNESEAERVNNPTYYAFSEDGQASVILDNDATVENALSITTRWGDTGTSASSFSNVGLTQSARRVSLSNVQMRLPEITFQSAMSRPSLVWFAPRPVSFFTTSSRFEQNTVKVHGRWLTVGGTLSFDASRKKGKWRNHITSLWPLPDDSAESDQWPTVADWSAMSDVSSSLGDATPTIGELKYVHQIV